MELKEVIKADCKTWERIHNKSHLFEQYLYLNECKNSSENGLYQLIFNGCELWYGTLEEINAVVKTMIRRLQNDDFLDC